nr:ribonuclease H-like domain-containing protein [Tanacetum cinerariifolium]
MNISTNTPTFRITNNTINELLAKLLDILGFNNSSPTACNMSQPLTTPIALNTSGPVPYISGLVGYYPTQLAQPTYMTQQVQSSSTGSTVSSGQATVMPYAFTTGTLHDSAFGAWNFDTCTSSHLNNSVNSLSENFNTSLHLNNILITPHMVKNFIFVRQFVRDNNCTIEFDAFGFSVKNFLTSRVLLRCDSTADLYPITAPSPIPHAFFVSQHTWHQRLGHPGGKVMCHLLSSNIIWCNKEKPPVLCHACQLGKHVRLPFVSSGTVISSCFDIIHSDATWTLVPRPPDVNVIRCMWLFRRKYLADGALSHYKARLVANGSTQLKGVDVDDTFSLIVKAGTTSTVLSLATSRHWLVHQLDVKNAFLHENLSETVYMHQPPNFRDSTHPNYKKYAVKILERAGMVNCNPSRTPVDTESKMGTIGDVVSDPTLYRSLTGSLQYLTFTRPDIFYAVQQVCLHMPDPREPHFSTLKRILHYVCGTLDYGLQLFSSSTINLAAYSDVDWAGCPTTRRSTSEYRGVANAVAETCWLRNLFRELHTPLSSDTLVYYDNVSVVYLSSNPIQHQRTKHIEIDIHFVHDLVATGQVWVLHVPSRYQFVDIFTKGLPSALFEEFCSSLSVRCPLAQTAGECLFLSQKKYALQLPERAHMVTYLSYAVQQICLYMHDSREPHFAALKRILRYVRGIVDFGLHLYVSASTSLVGYTNDWAGCPSTRTSTSGVGDEEVVLEEGVVVTSLSLEMLTNSCLGGIMEKDGWFDMDHPKGLNMPTHQVTIVILQQIIRSLNKEFDMTDLRVLSYFLGLSTDRTPTDLSYAVQQFCLYMQDSREPHFAALKCILRYVRGTVDFGLHLYVSASTSLVGYTNDWVGFPSTRRFTSGYCVFIGDNLLSWSVKRQHTISRSSAEAEYQGVANIVAETA